MGSGIAQITAQAGFMTIQFDFDEIMLNKSKTFINTTLQSLTDTGKITEEQKSEILQRIYFTVDIQQCKADVIIEAIVENKESKVNLFNQLVTINSPETIFATNTSSLSVSSIAENIKYSSNVIGMHFFNPAPLMKLVEVVQAERTNRNTVQKIVDLAKQLGKTPVICKDVPGFIVNRVARPYYLEAMKLVEAGLADVESIDKLMEASGFKMGPFKLMDLIGMDVNYAVSKSIWEALGKPSRLAPSIIQEQKIQAGELGRKTEKGFYKYASKP
jgi:3-hydroxybutyryl-CoA dehydrogenase